MSLHRLLASALLTSALLALAKPSAADQSLIKQPGVHPEYSFEAEPHLAVGFVDPPGGKDHGKGFGPGFRGTIELVDNGFISSINNTVGLGFGVDWFVAGGKKHSSLWVPVVMQWNFWLSRNWSVFGEPGGAVYFGDKTGVAPVFFAGGRFHFSDAAALTLRVGYPALTVGVSFLL